MRGSGASRLSVAPGGALAGPWVRNPLWRNARAVPSLDLRFADNKSLVDGVTGQNLVTFTRASRGTFVGSDGVLRSAVTNLLLRSEEFDNASWAKTTSTISSNVIVAPNGTLTSDKFIEASGSVTPTLAQAVSVTSGASYTFTVYAKDDLTSAKRYLTLLLPSAQFGSNVRVTFNLANGTSVSTNNPDATSIIFVGDGWYGCSVTEAATSTGSAGVQIRLSNAVPDTLGSYTGDGTSGIYIWGAQLEQSSTVGEYIPTTSTINSAPRFDHNPTTGESLGLLVEEARTNGVTNNTMVGAVAGTPGTNPTGWTFATAQSNGLTISIVGTGVENGINYIDYRFNGTTVASPNACAFGFTNASAVTGQTWTNSLYWRLASGSATGVTNWQLGIIENTAAGVFVTGAFYSQTAPTSAALITQRPTATRTLSGGVTVGLVSHVMNIPVSGNTAIDFTIRIGMPQVEQGAFATSVIPTTTATVTRAGDVASITGSNFSSFYNQTEGTFFCSTFAPKGIVVYGTGDTFDNTQYATVFASTNVSIRSGGADVAILTAPISTTGTTNIAHGYAANNFAAVLNGGTVSTDTSGAVPLAQVRLKLGSASWNSGSSNSLNGTIKRLTYWPVRLANTTLQQITQP